MAENVWHKWYSIERCYCKDATDLLSYLQEYAHDVKTFVTYNRKEVSYGKHKVFKVINIERHGREYLGFINYYKQVS